MESWLQGTMPVTHTAQGFSRKNEHVPQPCHRRRFCSRADTGRPVSTDDGPNAHEIHATVCPEAWGNTRADSARPSSPKQWSERFGFGERIMGDARSGVIVGARRQLSAPAPPGATLSSWPRTIRTDDLEVRTSYAALTRTGFIGSARNCWSTPAYKCWRAGVDAYWRIERPRTGALGFRHRTDEVDLPQPPPICSNWRCSGALLPVSYRRSPELALMPVTKRAYIPRSRKTSAEERCTLLSRCVLAVKISLCSARFVLRNVSPRSKEHIRAKIV